MSAVETLLGRESELQTIHALVDGVGDRGAALVVRGEPGIGKSELLEEASRYAESSPDAFLISLGVLALLSARAADRPCGSWST